MSPLGSQSVEPNPALLAQHSLTQLDYHWTTGPGTSS